MNTGCIFIYKVLNGTIRDHQVTSNVPSQLISPPGPIRSSSWSWATDLSQPVLGDSGMGDAED